MAITSRVKSQYFQKDKGLIRLAPSQDHLIPTRRSGTPWTKHEHELFLEALEHYPSGPWKTIAAYIGTRTTRQTMTHAQKYREKIARRQKAKGGASPTNQEKKIQVVTIKSQTQCEPLSNEPVSFQVQDIMETGGTTNNHCDVVELQLDNSVITLLEAVDMMPMDNYSRYLEKMKASYNETVRSSNGFRYKETYM